MNIKSKFKQFAISFLLVNSFISGSYCNLTNEQETKLYIFLQDFLDTKKDPKKPFSQWAEELIALLKSDSKFAEFCKKLNDLKTCKNARRLGLEFKNYKSLMPQKIKEFLDKHDVNLLLKIFEARLIAK